MIINCTTCNNELERNNSQIKASKTGNFFCGRDCKSKWHSIQFKEMKISIKCENCKNNFKIIKCKDYQKFCSRKCQGEFKTKNMTTELKCDNCNIFFIKKNSMINNYNFCNKKCSNDWNSKQSTKLELECYTCKNKFKTTNKRGNAKTCSKKCHYQYIRDISLNGHMNEILRKNGIKVMSEINKYDTLPEKITEEFLIINNIKFKKQYPMYNKFVVDFYLYEFNIVLEVFGDYWHANPKIYNSLNNNIKDWQLKQQIKDKNKKLFLEKKGHKFISIWENEVHKDVSIIKSLISN